MRVTSKTHDRRAGGPASRLSVGEELDRVLDRVQASTRALDPGTNDELLALWASCIRGAGLQDRPHLARSLAALREVLLRLQEALRELDGEVPPLVALRMRELAGHLYEARWLARQAGIRARCTAVTLERVRRSVRGIRRTVRVLGKLGQETHALVLLEPHAA